MMRLEDIGFYTLSDDRAQHTSASVPLARCELLLTGRCNFHCPYCRHVGGMDLPLETAVRTIQLWSKECLRNIRFSGGEPTLYRDLLLLVRLARDECVDRIALSTNGSADLETYLELVDAGVNDVSISLDACCAEDGDVMAGGVKGAWNRVITNIRELAQETYVTVGIVLTPFNAESVRHTILLAHDLNVDDIRVIPAAQHGQALPRVDVPASVRAAHPILRYRLANLEQGRQVRGLTREDTGRCSLVLDDMAVLGNDHYPCIIYLREGGVPIGRVGPDMHRERDAWCDRHDAHKDPICSKNCLDVCVDYNNKARKPCVDWVDWR